MTDQLSADLQSLRIVRGEPPKKGRSWGWLVVLALVLGGGAVAVRTFSLPTTSASFFPTEVAFTEVSVVAPNQAQVDLTSTGYVVPQMVAKVGARVVGRVTKSNVKEWDQVKAGQVLFVLDPSQQKAAIATAQARVMAARARAQAARANVTEVRLQWEREKRLAASGAVSQSTAEDLGARVGAMNETARAAEAEAGAVQAEVDSMKANLADLTVSTPIDGVASTKPVEVGDVVRPDQTLVEISDLTTLVVEADVAENRVGIVKPGGPCEITLDAFPGKRFRGEVNEVSPVIDRAKATAKVKVKFVDTAEGARGQMAARVSFLTKELAADQMKETPKNVIPSNAVVDRDGKKITFVVEDGKVRATPVVLGDALGAGFVVVSGPAPGTRLVRDPPPSLKDGQRVKDEKK